MNYKIQLETKKSQNLYYCRQ